MHTTLRCGYFAECHMTPWHLHPGLCRAPEHLTRKARREIRLLTLGRDRKQGVRTDGTSAAAHPALPRESWKWNQNGHAHPGADHRHSSVLRNSIRAARSVGDISVAKRQTAAKAAFLLSGMVSRRPQLVQTLVQTVFSAEGLTTSVSP